MSYFGTENMMKRFVIILGIFCMNLAIANPIPPMPNPIKAMNDSVIEIIDPPGTAALNIMVDALSSLKELKKQKKDSLANVKSLIQIKLMPYIAMDVSTELALKKHWAGLNPNQQLIFQDYITYSLIKDYAGILATYDRLDSVNIAVDPQIKRKDNKAIVKLIINLNDDPKPFNITLKMIRSSHWRVYDLIFSGVSLMKNYRAQFDSHIKRKGLESLVSKTTERLAKLK